MRVYVEGYGWFQPCNISVGQPMPGYNQPMSTQPDLSTLLLLSLFSSFASGSGSAGTDWKDTIANSVSQIVEAVKGAKGGNNGFQHNAAFSSAEDANKQNGG